jgi:inorganic phosphate transporter, PiT family
MSALTLLLVLLAVALVFDFLNGFHDSANVVATIIASQAMSARGAVAARPRGPSSIRRIATRTW